MKMHNTWFTSDTHFDHANIIKYCRRPFKNKEEMNEALIKNWNSVVKHEDTIFHLGDFAFNNNPSKFFHRLNGKKILIIGNHDKQPVKHLPWQSINSYYELKLNGQFIVLCHYAFRVFNKSHYGALQLFGHSHGTLPSNSQQVDVGVDCWNYTPTNLEKIQELTKTLPKFR